MKTCPNCRKVYENEYGFCLEDGTSLLDESFEQATVVGRTPTTAPIQFDAPSTSYCPACGIETKGNRQFCTRCGLPLGIVSEVLTHGGYLPQLAELNQKKKSLLNRRNGLGFSLIWFLFFLLIMTPLWGILNVERMAGASAIIGIFGGLIIFVSSLIFLKSNKPVYPNSTLPYGPPPPQNYNLPQQPVYQPALPPQQSIPVSAYQTPQAGSWRDTNDLQPANTESVTRMLEKDKYK